MEEDMKQSQRKRNSMTTPYNLQLTAPRAAERARTFSLTRGTSEMWLHEAHSDVGRRVQLLGVTGCPAGVATIVQFNVHSEQHQLRYSDGSMQWVVLKEYLQKLKDLELQVLVGATSELEMYRSQGKVNLLVRLEQLKDSVNEARDRSE